MRGIIGRSVSISDTKIVNAYIGDNAVLDDALLVENSTILSSSEEVTEISHGAYIINSIVQWGCKVTSMATPRYDGTEILCEVFMVRPFRTSVNSRGA